MTRVQSLWLVVALAIQVQAIIHSPPEIIKQPPTDEILFQVALQASENDKPFIIECEAKGEPAPKYYWIKNGKPYNWQAYDNRITQQQGRGSLYITSPRDEDLGQYQCFATNEHGTATSNSVFVRKSELNSFKDEPPKTLEVNEGEPFKLKCQPPDGWPKPVVYWLIQHEGGIKSINNSRMTLDPEGNLWFSNVTRDDKSENFYYACSASSKFRNEYKVGNRVLLDVVQTGISPTQNRYAPTRQYVSRKNELALFGKRIELFCIYGGTPLPQTVWTKDGNSIQWNDRVTQGNYGKSLIIQHTNHADKGVYTCEASNGVGSAQSYSINLDVNAVPVFVVEPEKINAAEDEVAEFLCEAEGIPEPSIKWIHNGKPIEEAPPNDRREVQTNKIVIRKLKKTDTGNYGCNATNSIGYVYKDVYLNVLALPPEIKEPPKNESTVDGRNITLTCRVFGAPKPRVKWVRNGLELTGGRYSVQDNGDLLINNVASPDAGNYTCYAENKFGTVQADGLLFVREHTRFSDLPQDYEVAARNSATFRCNAIADISLELEIDWLKDGQEIDFDSEPRFVRTNDHSLTISKTAELDSGVYTCRASTFLDSTEAHATLIVQDVPNAPRLTGTRCDQTNAVISWEPRGDNRAPILYYTIQYNTSFTPDTWEAAFEKVPATDFTYKVSMSPWSNYTFRVIAFNKIGPSLPSDNGDVCSTQAEVPFKNPDNVEGKGTEPNNIIVSWTHMPQIEHNGPHFQYRVYWKRDIPAEKWNTEDVFDWEKSSILIENQPTFQKYRLKVVAINEQGESNMAAREVIGYSGEDKPSLAPNNFTLVQVIDSSSALLSWNPVPIESVNGHFKGYKIQTWTEKEGEDNLREIHVKADSNKALVTKFTPFSKNYARIMVFNSRYNGPSSILLDFDTPEGRPSSVESLEARPFGSSAFKLTWKKPLQPNGILTGYKIYYEMVNGTAVSNKKEREPHVDDPQILQAKLAGLQPGTKYRVSIHATTSQGEGEPFYVEETTNAGLTGPPDVPAFGWQQLPSDTHPVVRVNWYPNLDGRPGSHFYTKYRVKGESEWQRTDDETQKEELVVRSLEANTNYEFVVVAVDGDFTRESLVQEVETSMDGPLMVPSENVASAGWFIGMMMAIVFLLLVLIIICIVKRNRGGKYDVHDRELAAGRRDYEEGGFHEYSQPRSTGRHSIASNLTRPDGDDDGDSLAEYGEGDTVQFTEDGSFIGQYVPPPISPQPTPHQPHKQPSSPPGVSSVATYV